MRDVDEILKKLGVTYEEYLNDPLVHDCVLQIHSRMSYEDLAKQLLRMVLTQKEELREVHLKTKVPISIQCPGGDNCPVQHIYKQKNPSEDGSSEVSVVV